MRHEDRRSVVWSPTQLEIIKFRAPQASDGTPQVEIVGVLGEYGGGKTYAAARRFLKVCSENPSPNPSEPLMSGISAPTFTGLMNGPVAAFLRLCPTSWIKKNRTRDTRDPHIILRNNHKIILYTGRGALDGPNLVQFWADEIQDNSYVGQWANMAGRVRDTRGRRLNAQASGIAQEGYVAQIFRNPQKDGRHLTKLLFPEENAANLAHGYVDLLKSYSAGGRQRDPDGWMTPDGLFYPAFCRERNIDPIVTPREALFKRATDISIDLGARAAVTWWQPVPVECNMGNKPRETQTGWLCVDQWMPDDMDADKIAALAKDFPWKIQSGVSQINLDPTAAENPDQLRAVRRMFPGVHVAMAVKGSFYWFNEPGERAVARAVLDMHDNARLYVHPDLVSDHSGRGIVEAMRGYRRDKPKDKKYEHVADTVRYQVVQRMPLPRHGVPDAGDPKLEARLSAAFKPISPKPDEVVY